MAKPARLRAARVFFLRRSPRFSGPTINLRSASTFFDHFAGHDDFNGWAAVFCATRSADVLIVLAVELRWKKRPYRGQRSARFERNSVGWFSRKKPVAEEFLKNVVSGPRAVAEFQLHGHRTPWRREHEALAGGTVCPGLVGRRGGASLCGLGQRVPGNM